MPEIGKDENSGSEASTDRIDREKRRRLLKGIVASAPVIMSVTSRPVLAARNCSESGQLSGNTSGGIATCSGYGCAGDAWKVNLSEFHHNYPSSAIFDVVFGIDLFDSATLGQVINQTADPNRICMDNTVHRVEIFGKQAVAALQNAATGVRYDLEVGDVLLTVSNAYSDAIAGKPAGRIGCQILNTTTASLRTLSQQTQDCPWNPAP